MCKCILASCAGCKSGCKLEGCPAPAASSPTASTPSSLASPPCEPHGASVVAGPGAALASPRPELGTLQQASTRLAAWSGMLRGCEEGEASPAEPQAPSAASAAQGEPLETPQAHMLALHDHAQLMQVDTELLREGLRGARRQLQALQRQLLRMQREAGRQQTLAETLIMEQECEVRLARSEAEAYRVAAAARNAAVASLQKSVSTLQEDKRRLEALVRKLQGSLKGLLVAQAELQRQQEAGSKEQREAVAALSALLRQKAEQLEQAQQAVACTAQTAAQVAGAVDSLKGQLAEAHAELAQLRGANAQLAQQLARSEEEAGRLRAPSAAGSSQQAEQAHSSPGEGELCRASGPMAAGVEAPPGGGPQPLLPRLQRAEARCADLEAANAELAQRAGAVAALQGEFEEAARQLVEACDQNALLTERLEEVRGQVAQLAQLVEATEAEKAELAAQLGQSRAEVLNLAHMVRALRRAAAAGASSGGIASPAGHAGGGAGGAAPLLQQRQRRRLQGAAGGYYHSEGPGLAAGQLVLAGGQPPASAGGSVASSSSSWGSDEWGDSSSGGEAERSDRCALASGGAKPSAPRGPRGRGRAQGAPCPATAAAGQRRRSRGAEQEQEQGREQGREESQRVELLEQEVDVLMNVVRRLQGQNRQLSAQLAAGGRGVLPALPPHPAPAPAPASLVPSACASPVKLPAKAAHAAAAQREASAASGELAAGWGVQWEPGSGHAGHAALRAQHGGQQQAEQAQRPEWQQGSRQLYPSLGSLLPEPGHHPALSSAASSLQHTPAASPGKLGAAAFGGGRKLPGSPAAGGALELERAAGHAYSQHTNPLFGEGEGAASARCPSAGPAASAQASLSQASSIQPRRQRSHSRGYSQPSPLVPTARSREEPPGALFGRPLPPAAAPGNAAAAAEGAGRASSGLLHHYHPPGLPAAAPSAHAIRDPPTPQSSSQPALQPPTAAPTLASSDSDSDVVSRLRRAIASLDTPARPAGAARQAGSGDDWAGQPAGGLWQGTLPSRLDHGSQHHPRLGLDEQAGAFGDGTHAVHGGCMARQLIGEGHSAAAAAVAPGASCALSAGGAPTGASGAEAVAEGYWEGPEPRGVEKQGMCAAHASHDSDSDRDIFDSPRLHARYIQSPGQPPQQPPPAYSDLWPQALGDPFSLPSHRASPCPHQQGQQQQGEREVLDVEVRGHEDWLADPGQPSEGHPCPPEEEGGMGYEAALCMLQQLQAEITSLGTISPMDGDGDSEAGWWEEEGLRPASSPLALRPKRRSSLGGEDLGAALEVTGSGKWPGMPGGLG